MDPYASMAELETYLDDSAPADAARLLQRASELIALAVVTPYEVDPVLNLPKETYVSEALRDATCAQVEWWLETGDEKDVLTGWSTISFIGALFLSGGGGRRLAPRAKDALARGNLLGGVVMS
jgi:hypothetical protein